MTETGAPSISTLAGSASSPPFDQLLPGLPVLGTTILEEPLTDWIRGAWSPACNHTCTFELATIEGDGAVAGQTGLQAAMQTANCVALSTRNLLSFRIARTFPAPATVWSSQECCISRSISTQRNSQHVASIGTQLNTKLKPAIARDDSKIAGPHRAFCHYSCTSY